MNQPIVWTIAGSDSGGGAGIQADLKTFTGLKVYGASVITAITAQNTLGVRRIEAVSSEAIKAQIEALHADLPATAVKTGMLHSTVCLDVVGGFLQSNGAYVVCDPVMVATSGDSLIEPSFVEGLKAKILPYVNLLTPNLEEAHKVLGLSQDKFFELNGDVDEYVRGLAIQLLKLGPKSVLIKGAGGDAQFGQDYWFDGKTGIWLTSLSQVTRHTHGTGCTLASAIAASVALGYEEPDALVISKAYVNQGLRNAPGLGEGQGPMAHLGWPENPEDLPWISKTSREGRERSHFDDCGAEHLGFYPIVDNFAWIEKLVPLGVKTIQLRIKDLTGQALDDEIRKAVGLCAQYNCRLFINDHWEIAIKHKAYGVHLGYEDLQNADIKAISTAGMRLGLSTHSYSEVATALAIRPSYIAIGPIFATTTKYLSAAPQSIAGLKKWRRCLNFPLVAIGGISLENAQDVKAAGADGIAVVGDITKAPDLGVRVERWLDLMR